MDNKRLETIIQIKSLVERLDTQTHPFLFYLPSLLERKEFSRFDPTKALEFTRSALKFDSHPVMKDALRILNNIIAAEDGTLKTPGPHHFFNNQYFFWNELGTYTSAFDIISHVFNRTIFFLSVTQNG